MNRWINVKEKLPDHYDEVICYDGKGIGVLIFVDAKSVKQETNHKLRLEDEGVPYLFLSKEQLGYACEVTHWMPLPDPPQTIN